MQRSFGALSFDLVGVLRPDRDPSRSVIEYMYTLGTIRLNPHGKGPFCNFRLAEARAVAGVYAITVQNDLVYIGECQNLSTRWSKQLWPHRRAQLSPRRTIDQL